MEGEDPKAFLMGSRDARYRNEILGAFCNQVQEALEHLDAGNAEHWPPPPGATPEEIDNANYSRWGDLWQLLEKVRNAFQV
jgi:hypothetical protein